MSTRSAGDGAGRIVIAMQLRRHVVVLSNPSCSEILLAGSRFAPSTFGPIASVYEARPTLSRWVPTIPVRALQRVRATRTGGWVRLGAREWSHGLGDSPVPKRGAVQKHLPTNWQAASVRSPLVRSCADLRSISQLVDGQDQPHDGDQHKRAVNRGFQTCEDT